MKKNSVLSILLIVMLGLLVGCGKKNLSIKVGNNLSDSYNIVEADKLDINKSMYYSVDGEVKKDDKLIIEINNQNENVMRSNIKTQANMPVLFKVKEAGKYKIILKDLKDKSLCEKEFIIEGSKIENIKQKQDIRKNESKEVRIYNDVVQRVEAAKQIRLPECIDIAKKSVLAMKDGDKKTSLMKQLDEIKKSSNEKKVIKGQCKVILGIEVVEVDLDYSKDCKVFVDYKEEKVYKTSKNKIRFLANKGSKIFIVKGNDIFSVNF